MTPEQWQRLTDVLGEVLDAAPADRAQLLETLCGADPALLERVKSLLNHHQRAGTFLEGPAALTQADCQYVLESADSVQPGDLIAARYRLDVELGHGAAGTVWKAHDARLDGKPVAIKLMHPYWLSSRWMRARFAREMRALARLRHPNAVSVLDYEETGSGQAFLVMELVDGATLRARLSTGDLTTEEIAAIVHQIADVIDAAHSRGILHRDLKPENIMITGAGVVKVLDFGMARVAEPDEDGAVHSTILAGTPGYMAPEQLLGSCTEAGDRFSLGAIVFEMLTGRRPFDRTDPSRMFDGSVRQTSISLRNLRPGLPPAVGDVIAGMLQVNPACRPRNARAFAESLELALQGRMRSRPSRRQFALGGLAALVSAGGAGVMWEHNGWGPLAAAESHIHWDVSQDLVDGPSNPGFVPVGDVSETIEWNASGRRDRLRIRSRRMGYYDRSLTPRQRRRAWQQGWIMRATLLPLHGCAFVSVNMVDFGPRLDATVSVDASGRTLIEFPTAIVPELRGPSILVPRLGEALHRIEIRFDSRSKTAQALVNGNLVADAYRGHTQYQTDDRRKPGLFLGVGEYKGSAPGDGFFGELDLQIL